MILLDDLLAGAAEAGARLAGGVFSREFEAFAHDSRNVRGGELFVAVRTERADGHDFIEDACRRGAAGVLCERSPDEGILRALGATCIVVDDTRGALRTWARYILRRQGLRIIGVSGSVGKTCATKAIAAVLRHVSGDPRAVFENDNFNDLFGLPISLSRLVPAHQIAVLELASDSAGEIAALCDIVGPQVAVVTNVAPAHLQHFGTRERLAEEIAALPAAATDQLILNRDDPLVVNMAGGRSAISGQRSTPSPSPPASTTGHLEPEFGHLPPVTWFGTHEAADVRAADIDVDDQGARFRLQWQGAERLVRLHLPGRHSVSTALAAAAVSLTEGYPLDATAAALETLTPAPGRLQPLAGVAGSLILDDTFSASPPTVRAALDTLALHVRPRIFVLGEVSGVAADGATYTTIGRQAAHVADFLLAHGDGPEPAARAAVETGLPRDRVAVTHTISDTVACVRTWLNASGHRATILVKGNEAARLERVVERLLAAPDTAPEVLVRQAPGAKQVVPLHQNRATWIEVDLGAIAANLQVLRQIAAPAEVMAVLKADAYGHGAVRVARTAVQHGAAMLGTAVLSEAATLRAHGITAPILVLGYTPPWQARDVARLGVAVALFSLDLAQHLSHAALALQLPPIGVHLKVDTGMHRLGLQPEQVVAFGRAIAELPGICVEGIFTHFATADAADPAYALEQLARFRRVLAEWDAAGLPAARYIHAANSAAMLRLPEAHFNLVRAGIALYGMHPSPDVPCPPAIRPALALKTQVAQVHELPAGEPVSYGATWITPRPSRIGVLPIGYADGFRRAPHHWGAVLIRGRRAPIVGRVCMDMCMIDVTDVPGARAGDEVVLIGEQGGDRLTAEEVAAQLGTINYEVVSQILARVPREIASG